MSRGESPPPLLSRTHHLTTSYRAIQASGLGRSAMAQMEALGTAAPLNATHFALDTVAKELQMTEESLRVLYDDRGHTRPAVVRSNEEWYIHQGYDLFEREEEGYPWKNPVTGEVKPIPIIYMKKKLL